MKRLWAKSPWLGSLLVLSSQAVADPVTTVSGTARVIDGDSLVIEGERIRINGIDACELDQVALRNREIWPCGELAAGWMVAHTTGKSVKCSGSSRDRYGRLLATCSTSADDDLGSTLVIRGLAVAYRRNGKPTVEAYGDFEIFAKIRGIGIWGAAYFVSPGDWRKGVR